MEFHRAFREGQADAGAAGFRREVRLENPLLNVFRHPRTIIRYRDFTIAARRRYEMVRSPAIRAASLPAPGSRC